MSRFVVPSAVGIVKKSESPQQSAPSSPQARRQSTAAKLTPDLSLDRKQLSPIPQSPLPPSTEPSAKSAADDTDDSVITDHSDSSDSSSAKTQSSSDEQNLETTQVQPAASPTKGKSKRKKKKKRSRSTAAGPASVDEKTVGDDTSGTDRAGVSTHVNANDGPQREPKICVTQGKTNHTVGDDGQTVTVFINRLVTARCLKVKFLPRCCELFYRNEGPDQLTWTWRVDLFDDIIVPECSFAVTSIGIELNLAKADLFKQWSRHIGGFHEAFDSAKKTQDVANDVGCKGEASYAGYLPDFEALKRHVGDKLAAVPVPSDPSAAVVAASLPDFEALKKHVGDKIAAVPVPSNPVAAVVAAEAAEAAEASTPTPAPQDTHAQQATMAVTTPTTAVTVHGDRAAARQAIPPHLVKYAFYQQPGKKLVISVFIRKVDKQTFTLLVDDAGTRLTLEFETTDKRFVQDSGGPVSNYNYTGAYRIEFPFSGKIVKETAVKTNCKVFVSKIELKLETETEKTWDALLEKTAEQKIEPSVTDEPMEADAVDAIFEAVEPAATEAAPAAKISAPAPKKLAGDSETASQMEALSSKVEALSVQKAAPGKTTPAAKITAKANMKAAKKADKSGAKTAVVPAPTPNPTPTPLTPLSEYGGNGAVGLTNLGNTCFMNAILQALSNTAELRDLFLTGEFTDMINTDNPLGSGGKMATVYAKLQRELWKGKSPTTVAPTQVKATIGKLNSAFSGLNQQDAQELMSFLLDYLHEDLNRIKKKPYIEIPASNGRPDEVVANETWSNYRKRNDSPLDDMFRFLVKNKLSCPDCGKISVKFETYTSLLLPLPQKHRRFEIRFVPRSMNDPLKMLGVTVPMIGAMQLITNQISPLVGVPIKNLILVVMKNGLFVEKSMTSRLERIKDGTELVCFAKHKLKSMIPVVQKWKKRTVSTGTCQQGGSHLCVSCP